MERTVTRFSPRISQLSALHQTALDGRLEDTIRCPRRCICQQQIMHVTMAAPTSTGDGAAVRDSVLLITNISGHSPPDSTSAQRPQSEGDGDTPGEGSRTGLPRHLAMEATHRRWAILPMTGRPEGSGGHHSESGTAMRCRWPAIRRYGAAYSRCLVDP